MISLLQLFKTEAIKLFVILHDYEIPHCELEISNAKLVSVGALTIRLFIRYLTANDCQPNQLTARVSYNIAPTCLSATQAIVQFMIQKGEYAA